MRTIYLGNGSDISRSAQCAVSAPYSGDGMFVIRDLLHAKGWTKDLYHWNRTRVEYEQKIRERMLVTKENTRSDIEALCSILKEAMDARVCVKGEKPKIRDAENGLPGGMSVTYDDRYPELLCRRHKLRCILTQPQSGIQKKPSIYSERTDDLKKGKGSLVISSVRYSPPTETLIASGVSKGLFESGKGGDHPEKFAPLCVADPEALEVPGRGTGLTSPHRLLRRSIRYAIDDMLSDTFILSAMRSRALSPE